MMVTAFKHDRTMVWFREVLEMSARTEASWPGCLLQIDVLQGPADISGFKRQCLFSKQTCQNDL